MSLIYTHGIAISSRTGTQYMDLSTAFPDKHPQMRHTKDNDKRETKEWARWGSDNKFPNSLQEDIDSTGILQGIIDGKARFAIGSGIVPAIIRYDDKGRKQIEKIVMDNEVVDFLEENSINTHAYAWLSDLYAMGNNVGRMMLNSQRNKIIKIQRDDVIEMRKKKLNDKGICEKIYLSSDWSRVKSVKDTVEVSLLNENCIYHDLVLKAKHTKAVELAFTNRLIGRGKKYYSYPDWYAAYKWVRIAQGVPEMKAAMFKHNFRPKYQVVISEKFWDNYFQRSGKSMADYTEKELDKKREELFNEIDERLFGNENAFKTIFSDGYTDHNGVVHPEIQITAIKDETKTGDWLPDAASANSEIAFAMSYNPAIIGASMPKGPYANNQGGSNVRESVLVQVVITQPEREKILAPLNAIKRFNGWDKLAKEPETRFEFIIPTTILTTLDTGSGVKDVVTGQHNNENSNDNGTDKNDNGNEGGNSRPK